MERSNYINFGFEHELNEESKRRQQIVVPKNDAKQISIAWRNLQFEVPKYGGLFGTKKPILRRLNGYFEQGSLNALMGPSGAGKSSLLNCLSGVQRSGLNADSEIY